MSYKNVFTSDKFCLFDETNGIDKSFAELDLPVFRDEMIADIRPTSAYLNTTMHENRLGQHFLWNNGKLTCIKGAWSKEYIYIHLQKRLMRSSFCEENTDLSEFFITQFGFFCNSKSSLRSKLDYLCLFPNLMHLKRFFLPRIIRTIKNRVTQH